MRLARKLDNGNYLVGHLNDKAVREYDGEGKMLREIKVPDVAFVGVRLPNGNTLIGYRGGVIEVDAQDKEVWHLTQKDLPDLKLYWICNLQRLANGNTLIVESNNGRAVEVAASGETVWEFRLPERTVSGDREMVRILPDLVRIDPAALTFLK